MSVPLASLRRGALSVGLHDSVGLTIARPRLVVVGGRTEETRRDFTGASDAESYLRYWSGDPGTMTSLRRALSRRVPGLTISSWTNEQVLRALGTQISNGSLVVVESRTDVPFDAGVSSIAATVATAAPAAPALPPPPDAPAVPSAAEVLEDLEEVAIEGAQVLPEVEQTLEQLDLSMTQLSLAKASLEPAPSGVSGIGTAMAGAGGSCTSTLDGL